MQPLIPVATVLEGALLGAVDTSYIAKRTGLGIAIALAVIYGAPACEVHVLRKLQLSTRFVVHSCAVF